MNKKIALIGTGMVGMSFAYASTIMSLYHELVLIDIDKERTIGEELDLQHTIPFLHSSPKIYAGTYSDCADADITVISAGATQRPGETRIDLVQKNTTIMCSVIKDLMASGFHGIILVASNPVDIMTYIAMKESGLPTHQVFGSGTVLDSGRLRHILGEKLNVSPRSIHSYIIGEHGDSSIPAFSAATIAGKPLSKYIEEHRISQEDLSSAYVYVRDAAYSIIQKKKATYYGIGCALSRIVDAIFHDERSVFTIGAYLDGQYGQQDVYIGVPAVIGRKGVSEIIEIPLSEEEKIKFDNSCSLLKEVTRSAYPPR